MAKHDRWRLHRSERWRVFHGRRIATGPQSRRGTVFLGKQPEQMEQRQSGPDHRCLPSTRSYKLRFKKEKKKSQRRSPRLQFQRYGSPRSPWQPVPGEKNPRSQTLTTNGESCLLSSHRIYRSMASIRRFWEVEWIWWIWCLCSWLEGSGEARGCCRTEGKVPKYDMDLSTIELNQNWCSPMLRNVESS